MKTTGQVESIGMRFTASKVKMIPGNIPDKQQYIFVNFSTISIKELKLLSVGLAGNAQVTVKIERVSTRVCINIVDMTGGRLIKVIATLRGGVVSKVWRLNINW